MAFERRLIAKPGGADAEKFAAQVARLSRGDDGIWRVGTTDPLLARVAGAVYHSRQRRTKAFPAGLFADPAWDMLLDLFINDVRGKNVPTGSLCIASGVPQTTALRSLGALVAAGLAARRASPDDRRVVLIALTDRGRALMRQSLTDVALNIRGLVPDEADLAPAQPEPQPEPRPDPPVSVIRETVGWRRRLRLHPEHLLIAAIVLATIVNAVWRLAG